MLGRERGNRPMSVAAPPTGTRRRARRPGARRRGRPPGTSRRELELVALRLFTAQGFEETTIDQIAAGAGVSRRAFFRYFDSKPDVLWGAFDTEVATIRALLDKVPDGLPVMAAVRRAVLAANHYRAADVPELRARMSLVGSVPALMASAAVHYDAWERAISDFVARRTGQPADSLYPLAVGRATLAACRAGYDRWVVHADADLTVYLDAALRALATGFADPVLGGEPRGGSAAAAGRGRRPRPGSPPLRQET
jgi:TetR/AcrR family transcriptional regulator, regulator of mycofactocin system